MPKTNAREKLNYLFQLLDDDSAEIQRIVRQEILNNSLDVLFNKEVLAQSLADADLNAFNSLLGEMHTGIILQALSQLLEDQRQNVDLERASLALSYWDNPNVDVTRVQNRLDQLADRVFERMPQSGHPHGYIDQVNQLLFQDEGFRGNASDYYNPHNSFLARVLDNKLGNPISLCLVYLLVSRRVSFPIYGVALPAHFILKFDNGEDEIFFDPFHGGKIYSRQTCLNYLEGFDQENSEAVLKGCSNLEIISRTLRNLHLIYNSYNPDEGRLREVEGFLQLAEAFRV